MKYALNGLPAQGALSVHWSQAPAAWLLSALLAAAPAPEPPKPLRVAVIAIGRCDAASSAISARSFRALLQAKLGGAIETEAETGRPFGGLSERTLDEVSRAVTAARREFYAHKADAAVAQLKALAQDVTLIAPSQERWKLEREVLTLLAQAQLASDEAAAEVALVSVLRVDPSYQPNTALYPPTFRKFADGLRARLAELPTNRLDVAVFPSGTQVYVGGCPVGTAPLSHRFPAGEYRVEADFGHRGLVRTVRIPDPPALVPPVELAAGVEGAISPDGGPCLEPGVDRQTSLARTAKLVAAARLFSVHTETTANRRWVMVEEVDALGSVLREARSEVQPGSPETDALGALAEWAATDQAPPMVEVVKRAATAPPATSTHAVVSGQVLGQPAANGFQLQAFPYSGQLAPGPAVHFSGDRFKSLEQPKGKTAIRVVTDDGRVGTAVVDVPASGNVDATVRVDRACIVGGRVLDAQGQPASGAHLVVQQLGTRIFQSAEAGPKGGFQLKQLTKGEHELTIVLGNRRLVRRFSPGDACAASLGTLKLLDTAPSSSPSGSRDTATARDH